MKAKTGKRVYRKKKDTQDVPRALKECPNHKDCNSCVFGYCTLLEDVDFGGRDCVFYKSKTQFEKDFAASIEKLKSLGRMDLIHLYHPKEAKKIERQQAKS